MQFYLVFFKKKDKKSKEFINIKIKNLIEWNEENGEECLVSDKILKDGFKVWDMYREQLDDNVPDSS